MSLGSEQIKHTLLCTVIKEYYKKCLFNEPDQTEENEKKEQLTKKEKEKEQEKEIIPEKPFLIGDYGSGRNQEVPKFYLQVLDSVFQKEYPNLKKIESFCYCADLHPTRLFALFNTCSQEDILERTRLVISKLETMSKSAKILDVQKNQLQKQQEKQTWLDKALISTEKFPESCFDLGVLNNDMVGFLAEYYSSNSDLMESLEEVKKSIRTGGHLLVTSPNTLHKIDNIKVLEEVGFKFVSYSDYNIKSEEIVNIFEKEDVPRGEDRKLDHFNFLFFVLPEK
ncbi:hypothetical protein M0812_01818 [Anaeramoeba flamelloides]|uniref:Uncharacterized protein n=1 Tax=Anaeramoeba flamelloides TaxID=1746091 RepID=A0AAV7YXT5_9EUKA|nr:hypothetical protein M0812_01818 [Anaeramoeba flamelloides]